MVDALKNEGSIIMNMKFMTTKGGYLQENMGPMISTME